MSGLTLAQAIEQRDAAYTAMLQKQAQSVTYNGRSTTREDLAALREDYDYWCNKVEELQGTTTSTTAGTVTANRRLSQVAFTHR